MIFFIFAANTADDADMDIDDIFNMMTQVASKFFPAEEAAPTEDDVPAYDMPTQINPACHPYLSDSANAVAENNDDIYDVLTQQLPVNRDHVMDVDFDRVPTCSTPHKTIDILRQRNAAVLKRKSPDSQEGSIAKMIPKCDEPPVKKRKPTKKKQMWLFVSSSDEEGADDFWSGEEADDQPSKSNNTTKQAVAEPKAAPSTSKPKAKAISVAASNSRLCLSRRSSKETSNKPIMASKGATKKREKPALVEVELVEPPSIVEKPERSRKRQSTRKPSEEASTANVKKTRQSADVVEEAAPLVDEDVTSKRKSSGRGLTVADESKVAKPRKRETAIAEVVAVEDSRTSRASTRSNSARSSVESVKSTKENNDANSKKSTRGKEKPLEGSKRSTRKSTMDEIMADTEKALKPKKLVVHLKQMSMSPENIKTAEQFAKEQRAQKKADSDKRKEKEKKAEPERRSQSRSGSANSSRDRNGDSTSMSRVSEQTKLIIIQNSNAFIIPVHSRFFVYLHRFSAPCVTPTKAPRHVHPHQPRQFDELS